MSIFNATAPSGGGEVKTATASAVSTTSMSLTFPVDKEPSVFWLEIKGDQYASSSSYYYLVWCMEYNGEFWYRRVKSTTISSMSHYASSNYVSYNGTSITISISGVRLYNSTASNYILYYM